MSTSATNGGTILTVLQASIIARLSLKHATRKERKGKERKSAGILHVIQKLINQLSLSHKSNKKDEKSKTKKPMSN